MQTPEKPTRLEESGRGSTNRAFGIVLGTVFLIVALWPLWHSGAPRVWAVAVSAAFLLAALFAPSRLAPLNRLWARLGVLLHKVVSPIVLGLVFYGVVTPIGVVMRLLGKDFLRLRRDPATASYWIERQPPGPTPESLKNQF